MQKDLKIGMLLGLVIAVATAMWLATRQNLSIKSRLLHTQRVEFQHKSAVKPPPAQNIAQIAGQQKTTEVDNWPSGVVDLTIYEQPDKIKTQKFHIVGKGETLSAIAKKYYGSAGKVKKIYDANRETITNINMLKPGTKLIIPD